MQYLDNDIKLYNMKTILINENKLQKVVNNSISKLLKEYGMGFNLTSGEWENPDDYFSDDIEGDNEEFSRCMEEVSEFTEQLGKSYRPEIILRALQREVEFYNKPTINEENLKEISADLADRAATKAYQLGREGFGKYDQFNEIPFDSPHGKKFFQGEKFLKYRNNKLGMNNGIGIFYPNGDNSTMVLKNYNTGEILTKPCSNIKELEKEYDKYKAQH